MGGCIWPSQVIQSYKSITHPHFSEDYFQIQNMVATCAGDIPHSRELGLSNVTYIIIAPCRVLGIWQCWQTESSLNEILVSGRGTMPKFIGGVWNWSNQHWKGFSHRIYCYALKYRSIAVCCCLTYGQFWLSNSMIKAFPAVTTSLEGYWRLYYPTRSAFDSECKVRRRFHCYF